VVVAFAASIAIERVAQEKQDLIAVRIYGLINIGVICFAAAVVLDYLNRLAWINVILAKLLGSTDALTGLSTRTDFNRSIVSRLRLAHRENKRIAVMLIDIDHFKNINDTHGHLVGDSVLRSVGALLRRGFADRPNDLKVRFGGEEILLFWYDITIECVAIKAESVLQAIRELKLEHAGQSYPLTLRASAGVTHGIPGPGADYLQFLAQTDALLYQAKREGRDRLCLAPQVSA